MSDYRAWLEMTLETIRSSGMEDGLKKTILDAVMADAQEHLDPSVIDEIEASFIDVVDRGELSDEVLGLRVAVNVCQARRGFGFEVVAFHEGGDGRIIHANYGYETAEEARAAGEASAGDFLKDIREIAQERGMPGPDL